MKRVENNRPVEALLSMPSNEDAPATKSDLNVLRKDIVERMDRIHEDLIEKMRDMQTEVLRAFHAWARPIEIRLRAFDDMQQRLGLLEERVGAIQRGDKPAA
ncbi:MAG: hypothetical protein LAO79_13900 [Acidobacteriia bacterium]|nr:hypothetical protein [Terriglobia bacterium]